MPWDFFYACENYFTKMLTINNQQVKISHARARLAIIADETDAVPRVDGGAAEPALFQTHRVLTACSG